MTTTFALKMLKLSNIPGTLIVILTLSQWQVQHSQAKEATCRS
jgi:cytochrome oxidase assembly protein ShyY1